eukprot:m51a1_g2264 putative profilin ii (128) ;mRNA; f:339796-340778
MSWQAYVDQQLIGTGQINQGAILGLDGNIWAKSKDFALKAGEGAKLVANFKDPASAQGSGIYVNGNKYMTLKADANSVYGKKSGNGGVITVKTKQAVLVGLYPEGIQAGAATNVVERLGDYLRENNY